MHLFTNPEETTGRLNCALGSSFLGLGGEAEIKSKAPQMWRLTHENPPSHPPHIHVLAEVLRNYISRVSMN